MKSPKSEICFLFSGKGTENRQVGIGEEKYLQKYPDPVLDFPYILIFVPESKPHTIMIRLNVFIKVDESRREAVIETAKKLVASSLEDKGCIAYDIFASQTRPDVLMICETWSDAAALDVHQKSAHFTTLVPEIESMAQMKIESFEF